MHLGYVIMYIITLFFQLFSFFVDYGRLCVYLCMYVLMFAIRRSSIYLISTQIGIQMHTYIQALQAYVRDVP
jgi:hypothetical protein